MPSNVKTSTMKRLISILLLTTLSLSILRAADVETLNYKINYHWGLIDKTAGRAKFTLRQNPDGTASAEMAARTEPWADRFYKVRDTLLTTFDASTKLPLSYHRIAHEDGQYASDLVTFTKNSSAESAANCIRLRRGKKDKTTDRKESTLSASGEAVDLLSSFYYLRNLDFQSMNIGETKTLNIFSGKRKEILKITYGGPSILKIDGKKQETLLITFTFTSDQGKTTSKPIKAYLSPDSGHIPLKLVGELKIGKVECYYTGKQP